MKQLNRRGILKFLGTVSAAAVPAAGIAAAAQPQTSPLDSMSFEECRFLWNEHLSLAHKCLEGMVYPASITDEKLNRLRAEYKNHMKRYADVYRFATAKFGDILPRSIDGKIQ